MALKPLHERIHRADELAGRYLGNANEAQERGNKVLADRLYEKGQFWLDRYNLLSGNGERPAPKR